MVRAFLLLLISIPGAFAQDLLHSEWDSLLKKHVSKTGVVDYIGFKAEKERLDAYLDRLSSNKPDKTSWTTARQLAYWINAYNAFTVKLIVDHYPLKSIKDLNPSISIPLVNTVWQEKFFKIGGEEMSLDEIEHDILREEFNEPRIHFAINCASVSCPVLLNEAYSENKIEAQLQTQAVRFINDKSRNKITRDKVQLSQVFNWFRKDFTRTGSLIDFINKYSLVKVDKNAEVGFLEYDWNLNEE